MTEKQTFSITIGVSVATDSNKDLSRELRGIIIDYLKSIGCDGLVAYYLNSNHVVIDGSN